ncbi:hypothetical protein S7711_07523 [Stachybotrys chartarum IBT 7711]|uniref:lytic cellulose monooxygenase (C4-dehydrogenating) n=1 Tax=Stachybotrys chartarum (strain CBS 109288 / IBT 7711) TaxID=1280523 RepID=A0A084AK66_STACB|nr:hypothetical protein S7711_07523 [Stachybotrys chartarum IBT 7711]KFA54175.1 hypothetical protein S40293_06296 [Stachybotrys chartarum IBT 40293]
MKFIYALGLLGAVAEAHYTIPRISANGVRSADWEKVRRTANYQHNGPVTDVRSESMTCYQLSPGASGATVLDVTAGGRLTFEIAPNIYHPGPVNVYMARAPGSVVDFDGKGQVWFKVYSDRPTVTSSSLQWPSDGRSTVEITVPQCIANGEYLVRFEHIGLHSASAPGGAQLYISCGQVRVSGGSGSARPSLMSFPGAYSPSDPGLQVNIYYPIPTNYRAPGGDALVC